MKSVFRSVRVPLLVILLSILTAIFVLPHTQAATGKTPIKKVQRKQSKILYAPTGYKEVGIILTKGKEYKYYLFSRETPLTIELKGPTTLTIGLRLLYDITMKGNQNFSFVIQEEGIWDRRSEVASYWFTAEKSRISSLQGESGMVPSKAHRFKLVVPEGEHRYTLNLQSTTAKSAAIRILIPRQDVQPQKKGKR